MLPAKNVTYSTSTGLLNLEGGTEMSTWASFHWHEMEYDLKRLFLFFISFVFFSFYYYARQ